MAQETSVKQLHSEEKNEPYNTLNRTNNTEQQLWKIATEKKREQQQNQQLLRTNNLRKSVKKKKSRTQKRERSPTTP